MLSRHNLHAYYVNLAGPRGAFAVPLGSIARPFEEMRVKFKLVLLIGGAIGYVLGTRDGRRRYEQVKHQAERLWQHPDVQTRLGEVDQRPSPPSSAEDELDD